MTLGSKDILIVGGGVIGLSIARELRRRGAGKISIIEAGACGGEASWAAAGMLGPQAETDETGPFFDLCLRSRDLYPAFADELLEETGIDVELDRSGTFYVAFSEHDSQKVRERFDRQKSAGLAVELLDAASVRKAEPLLSTEILEALYFSGDWQVDNRKVCTALRKYCEINKIEIRENTRVSEVILDGSKVNGIRAGSETIAAGEVVMAAGAWTSQIPIGSRQMPMNVEPVLGQMIAFRADTKVFQRVIYCSDGYIVPRRDGRVLAGSTTEKTGFERKTTNTAAASLFSTACKIVPGFVGLSTEDHWSGFRPRAADGFPVIGRIEGIDGLFIATAHYRNGILLAPATAAFATDAIIGGKITVDQAIFGPDRFRSLANSVSI
jgi:glycine oxidase